MALATCSVGSKVALLVAVGLAWAPYAPATATPAAKRAFIDCVGNQAVSVKQRENLVPSVGHWGPALAPYEAITVFEGDEVYFHPPLASSTGDSRLQVYLFEPGDANSKSRFDGYAAHSLSF